MIRNPFLLACLFLLLTSCAAPAPAVISSSTPDPIQAYVDANASQGTAVAAIATASYFSNQLTATVESRNQTVTQQAMQIQAQATERAWNATSTADSIQSTTVAVSTASAVAQQAIWTQRAMDITATADTASVQAFATKQYSIARTEELSLKRKELMNNVVAVTPWAMLIITFVFLALFFKRWTRVRVIQRAPNGDAPLLLDVVDGIAYDADRHPTSTAGLMRRDLKKLPQFSPGEQLKITTQDQMLDMTSRAPHDTARKAIASSTIFNASTPPQIQVLDSAQARPLFQDVIPHLLQDSIEADLIKDNNEGDANG
jgi:hypothetical protein